MTELKSYCSYYKRPCNINGGLCSECGERLTNQAPPNTTPLNEELEKILKEYAEGIDYHGSDGGDRPKAKQELTNLIQTLEKKAYENGLHDGEQVATFVFIKRLQARKKNTAPNSGAGREIKDLLKELEK